MWSALKRFGQKRDDELRQELEAHIAMSVRERMARGEPEAEARLAARREFGNRLLIEEEVRAAWGARALGELVRDARYAFRGMRREPGFAAVAVLSLALGIGGTTAIFSLLYTVMLQTLPVERPDRLVEFLRKYPGEPRTNDGWSPKSLEYYRDTAKSFASVTGMNFEPLIPLRLGDSEPRIVFGESVLDNYFETLGARPALGHLIEKGDPQEAVVLSWKLWDEGFAQSPAVLGKTVEIRGKRAVVVGIAPKGFAGLRGDAPIDLWFPGDPKTAKNMLARLRDGATIQQARAEMESLFRFTIDERMNVRTPDPQVLKMRVEVESIRSGMSHVRDRWGSALVALMLGVAALLLIACANVAGMLFARGLGRARELSLRLALGASRWRLMRQALTESLALSFAGTALGGVVAWLGTRALIQTVASARPFERVMLEVHPGLWLFLASAGLALGTGVLFGMAPALLALRAEPMMALKQAGAGAQSRASRWAGQAALSAQVALSLVLLGGAATFLGHLSKLERADLGFRRDEILLVSLDPSQSGYRGEALVRVYRDLLERIDGVPGVQAAALAAPTPLSGAGASGFGSVEGVEERAEDRRWISIAYAGPRYFETMGIPVLAGRGFEYADSTGPLIAVINSTLARQYFPGRDPVGRRITMDHMTGGRGPFTYEIVGVVGDANYLEIHEPERRAIYMPAFVNGTAVGRNFVIRSSVPPERIEGQVRSVLRDTAPSIRIDDVQPLARQIDSSIVVERLVASMSGFFALLGAALAGIGICGLLTYNVNRRRSEVGIRLALGASRAQVVRPLMSKSAAVVIVGILIGGGLCLWGKATVESLIANLTVEPSSSLAAAVGAMIVVALVASCAPALRAARVDPAESLRVE